MAQYKGAASEGSRAMQMMKKREQAQEEVEFRKKKIEEELKLSGMKDKFASHYDAVEQQLKVCLQLIFFNEKNLLDYLFICSVFSDLNNWFSYT
jgi:hypothetical protein